MEDINGRIKEIYQEIDNVRKVKKCKGCECLLDVLEAMDGDLELVTTPEVGEIRKEMKTWLNEGNKERHGCLGCEVCLPIKPYNSLSLLLKERSGAPDISKKEASSCGSCGCGSACLPKEKNKWPIVEGDYMVGDPKAAVAVCTLADVDLPNELQEAGALENTAIIGTLATENLGIEKIIKNLVSNPSIEFLLLCGKESRGHKAGQAIISLKNNGLDEDKRIIGAGGPRPILKNITYEEVQAFRKNISVVDEIGTKEVSRIIEIIEICKDKSKGGHLILPMKINIPKVIDAQHLSNREWVHDPEGFFIIFLNKDDKKIVCEHYVKEGIMGEVIKGTSAEDIANTAIKRGLVSRLDHAAYLGRELAKAEAALNLKITYTQDQLLHRGLN